MNTQIPIAAALVISWVPLYGQTQSGSAATETDHPSNGVVELSVKPVEDDMHSRDPDNHAPYGPWDGLVWITIRNVSRGMAHIVEVPTVEEYTLDVVDSSGKAVPLTEEGERKRDILEGHPNPERAFRTSIYVRDLYPTEELKSKFDFALLYQVRRGQAYKIRFKRTGGLPTVDENGKPLKRVEVSYSFEVPDYGVPR